MFDTAIIYKTVTRNTVSVIINRLKALNCRQRYFKSGRARIFPATHELQRYGIKYIAMINQPEDTYANVYMSFSLQGLCSGDSEHLFLPSDDNIRLLKDKFTCLMKDLGIVQGTGLEAWTVSRLDFAVDVETPYAEQYIQLMKKAKQPYRYKMLCNKAGSLYSGTQTRTTVFNHYDKTNERKSRGLQNDIDVSTHVLRMEVQVKSTRKLKIIADKHGLGKKSLLDFLKLEIAKDIIKHHEERFGLNGDYLSMAEATCLIKASSKQKQTKQRMIAFLTKVTKCHNVNAARLLYEAEKGGSSTDLIRSLRQLGINPVTIPCRANMQRLSGIIRLVEDEFDKFEAKNQVYQDKNSLFPRNENIDGTLPEMQPFDSKDKISAGFRASATGHVKTLLLKVCILRKMAGKNKNIRTKKGSRTGCDCFGKSKPSHYRGPPNGTVVLVQMD